MNWLKKSLLIATTAFAINQANAQTLNYDTRFSMLNAKLGDVEYDMDTKHLKININHFVNIKFTYQMINDSTYIETKESNENSEVFTYSKKDSSWVLDDYMCLRGEPRAEKTLLENTIFDPDFQTSIETLEDIIQNEISDSTKVILFGIPYTIVLEDKYTNSPEPKYKGNIAPYEQEKSDEFLIEDGIEVTCKKEGDNYIPQSLDAKTKILQIFNVGARVRIK